MAADHLNELHIFSHTAAILKIRKQPFHWHLFTVHIQGHKICIMKFKVERVLSIIAAKSTIIYEVNNKLGKLRNRLSSLLTRLLASMLKTFMPTQSSGYLVLAIK